MTRTRVSRHEKARPFDGCFGKTERDFFLGHAMDEAGPKAGIRDEAGEAALLWAAKNQDFHLLLVNQFSRKLGKVSAWPSLGRAVRRSRIQDNDSIACRPAKLFPKSIRAMFVLLSREEFELSRNGIRAEMPSEFQIIVDQRLLIRGAPSHGRSKYVVQQNTASFMRVTDPAFDTTHECENRSSNTIGEKYPDAERILP